MNDPISYHYKALELIKHWSSLLQIIETLIMVSIIFIVALAKNEYNKKSRRSLFLASLFTILSIIIGLNVLGTLPWVTQSLPQLAITYSDVYQYPNYIGIPIWILAFAQHLMSVLGMCCLIYFVFSSLNNQKPTKMT